MSSVLEYLGHSCFLLTADNGWKGIFDPYADGSVPGLKLPDVHATDIFISHQHRDHNAAELVSLLQHGNPCPYEITVLKTDHDDQSGSLRGSNDITILKNADETIVHCGDLGRMLTESEIHAMRHADVLMIPCGGHYTIDASQACAILKQVEPKLTVLMHYRRGAVGYDVLASLEEVCQHIPNVQVSAETAVQIGAVSGVIALQPKQES